MEAKDLRIGNWYLEYDTYKKVTPNTILELWESERIWANPIPLTPEIFEKAGFEKMNSIYWSVLNKNLSYRFSITFTGNNYTSLNIPMDISIKYLHQLQNLYFALTGEELNINL